jgi:hypothetical protein
MLKKTTFRRDVWYKLANDGWEESPPLALHVDAYQDCMFFPKTELVLCMHYWEKMSFPCCIPHSVACATFRGTRQKKLGLLGKQHTIRLWSRQRYWKHTVNSSHDTLRNINTKTKLTQQGDKKTHDKGWHTVKFWDTWPWWPPFMEPLRWHGFAEGPLTNTRQRVMATSPCLFPCERFDFRHFLHALSRAPRTNLCHVYSEYTPQKQALHV